MYFTFILKKIYSHYFVDNIVLLGKLFLVKKGITKQSLMNKSVVPAYWAEVDIRAMKRSYDDMR